ncbi:MAG: toxin-antitoxin system protein [Porphyromonas sp.]|jgi:hypothetical protein|nr:MAG: toxin-antitoxin system protein [Porphyromonas sp.]
MSTLGLKEATSIRIDAGILEQIKREAKADNRSLSNYLETLLYRLGYRPYNEDTFLACQDARNGKSAGVVDTSSKESILSSILGDNDTED